MQLYKLKKHINKFIAFAIICTAMACQKTLDLNVNTFEPSIAIFGVLEADSVPKLFITESEPYYTYVDRELPYKLIENATITLTDGSETWTLQPDSVNYIPIEQRRNNGGVNISLKKSLVFTTNINLKANTTYTVSVTKNNNTATATTTVLGGDINNFDATIIEEEIEYEYGDFIQETLNVNFNSSNYGHYYRILLRETQQYYNCTYRKGTLETVDTIINGYSRYFPYSVVSDTVDIQSEKVFYYKSSDCIIYNCITRENEFFDFYEVDVAIQLIDSNMVKYINQLTAQEEVAYNPFLEPAPVDHLVNNGIGILSSSTISPWKKLKILCD